MTGFGHARGIEQHAVVKPHQAGRDKARAWTDRSEEILGGKKPVSPRNDLHAQPARGFQPPPSAQVGGELAARPQDLILGLPVEARRPSPQAPARATPE